MIIDWIFQIVEKLKQLWCRHEYEEYYDWQHDSTYYQCQKCERVIIHEPPTKLIKQEKKQ